MEQNPESTQIIRNDYRPEFLNGQPTELQIIREFSYLFDHVLNGYSVPFQLRKFLFKIFTLTKDGKTYAISDNEFADQLGGVCKNYVVKLRKNLRGWFNAENESGIRNYSFVSIKENSYDAKTKKQKPTEYSFSLEFTELLGYLTRQYRQHKKYKENWKIALKEVCATEKTGRLTEFGVYDQRKKKRERSADNIFGTFLLNYKRLSGRMLEFLRSQGFAAGETKEVLASLQSTLLDQAHQEMILKESTLKITTSEKDLEVFLKTAINYANEAQEKSEQNLLNLFAKFIEKSRIKSTDNDFNSFIALATDYAQQREEKTDTVFPEYREIKKNVRSNERSNADNAESANEANRISENRKAVVDNELDNQGFIRDSQEIQPKATVDSEWERLLGGYKKRE